MSDLTELAGRGAETAVTDEEGEHSEKNWRMMLGALKRYEESDAPRA